MRKLEVLISTMNQKENDLSIYKKMNLNTDALIINQSNSNNYVESLENNKLIRMLSFNERGVGLSRNSALARATGDICLMADDDMVYLDNYQEVILDTYKKYPEADFIIFDTRIHSKDGVKKNIKKDGRVSIFNFFKFGTVHFTFKRTSIIKNNIMFSVLFGGRDKLKSGEDSLFLWEVIRKKLKVYKVPIVIADVYNFKSSWFKGFDDQYYFDRGALYRAMSPILYHMFNIYIVLRTRKSYTGNKSIFQRIKIAYEGSNYWKEL